MDGRNTIEIRMEDADFLKRIISVNEKLSSDSAIPSAIREEFRLLMQELQKTTADHQLKVRHLTEVNNDLMNVLTDNPVSHYFVDKNLCLRRFFSGSAEEIQRRSSDIGKSLEQISGHIRFCNLIGDVKRSLMTGEVYNKEVADVDNRWFNVLIVPDISKADRSIKGARLSVNDVTALKDLQKKLDDRTKSLIRINEDLDNFVYTTSRHLFEPLSRLMGLLELLKAKIPSGCAGVSNVIDKVEHAVGQFKEHLSELDQIGVIETQMLKALDPINIESLVEDVRLGIHDLLESSGTTIITDFGEKQINFSKKSLRSILLNLITSSVRRRSPNRKLELYIVTYAVPGYIVLMVKDNGLEVRDDMLPTLFKKANISLDGIPHEGLGLYLVKRIIDACGGKIEVESTPGEGTVFRVYLRFDLLVH